LNSTSVNRIFEKLWCPVQIILKHADAEPVIKGGLRVKRKLEAFAARSERKFDACDRRSISPRDVGFCYKGLVDECIGDNALIDTLWKIEGSNFELYFLGRDSGGTRPARR
jgi:hypothetical protein